MNSQEQSTQTEKSAFLPRRFCGVKLKAVLKFGSSLLLPLVLGVFTLVITLQQQEIAKKQREEDRNATQKQREDDRNATQKQREDDAKAAKELRELERHLSSERYENEVLDTYVKEMASILKENNGSLTRDEVTSTISRVKTLNIFRQLNSNRNIRVIRFLYEAKQLLERGDRPPLDLSTAELSHMDFRDLAINKEKLDDISLTGIFLFNVTFADIDMTYVKFDRTKFNATNFSNGKYRDISFESTKFNNADFSDIQFINASFSSSELTSVNFSNIQANGIYFPYAKLNGTDFSYAVLNNAQFSNAKFTNPNFHSAILNSANFDKGKASHTDLQQTNCVRADFKDADLSYSDFRRSNAKKASFINTDLTNVSFHGSNLYKANFQNSTITDDQLQSALSIDDVVLPNGTVLKNTNLLINGYAECNSSLNTNWALKTGVVSIKAIDKDPRNCRFVLESYSTGASISQRINLSEKWDSTIWSYSQAVLSAQVSPGVCIELRAIDSSGFVSALDTLNHTKGKANLILRDEVRELEVFVEFNASANENVNNSWCDDIRLIIVYDAYGEFQQVIPNIPTNTEWSQNGVTIAGGQGQVRATNQLNRPHGLFVDDDQTILIADCANHRVVQWKRDDTNGHIVAGGKNGGSGLDQFDWATDVLIEKETNSLIICGRWNRRVVRWSRRSGTTQGQILFDNIDCHGLAMDDQRNLYVSDIGKHEVRRYQIGDKNGTLVAGGNGTGSGLNQLNFPAYIFVDRQQTVYVSDSDNHRVIKWHKGATEGIVVAGNQSQGSALTQLSYPEGLFVDTSGTLYVADNRNHRVIRWPQGAPQGTVIAGGNGQGSAANQLNGPQGLSSDRQNNLYVADENNNRVQRFTIQ